MLVYIGGILRIKDYHSKETLQIFEYLFFVLQLVT